MPRRCCHRRCRPADNNRCLKDRGVAVESPQSYAHPAVWVPRTSLATEPRKARASVANVGTVTLFAPTSTTATCDASIPERRVSSRRVQRRRRRASLIACPTHRRTRCSWSLRRFCHSRRRGISLRSLRGALRIYGGPRVHKRRTTVRRSGDLDPTTDLRCSRAASDTKPQ